MLKILENIMLKNNDKRREHQAETDSQNGQEKKTLSKRQIALIVCIALFLTLVSTVLISVFSTLGRIEYASERDMVIPDNIAELEIDTTDDKVSDSDTLSSEEMAIADQHLSENQVDENGLRYQDGVTNILLLGTDGRSASETRARSDSIIIMSINDNTKKIVLSSIMRDTYVYIPKRNVNEKITHAHVYGGPALTMETIETNFGIKLDHFASVNFFSFIDIVDALGGVNVPMSAEEMDEVNERALYILDKYNKPYDHPLYVNETGESVSIDGLQALNYCRIRYLGRGDYDRAERQRIVLSALLKKAEEADYASLISAVNTVADNTYTDFTSAEILKLAMNASKYKDYEIVQYRIPDDSTNPIGGIYQGYWVLRIDLDANRELLYKKIFE